MQRCAESYCAATSSDAIRHSSALLSVGVERCILFTPQETHPIRITRERKKTTRHDILEEGSKIKSAVSNNRILKMLKARCVLRSASSSCAAARVAASRTPRSRVVASATQPIYHRANRQSTLATRHEPSPRFFSTFPPARTQTTPPTPTLTPLPEFPSVVLDDAPVADSERRYADPEAVFVVSGSGQGIGTAIVEQLLRRSVGTVVCLGRRPDQSAGLDALGAAFGTVQYTAT